MPNINVLAVELEELVLKFDRLPFLLLPTTIQHNTTSFHFVLCWLTMSSSSSTKTISTMKRILVGGPLLGQKNQQHVDPRKQRQGSSSSKTFEPLISPEIKGASEKAERFVLLPNARFVSVLAYKTGKRVGSLMLSAKDKETPVIECLTLATYPKKPLAVQDLLATTTDADSTKEETDEHVLLVGCRDGTIHEFSLSELLYNPTASAQSNDCGPYQVAGKCYRPRRVFAVSDHSVPVKYLTAPTVPVVTEHGIAVYVSVEEKKSKTSSKVNASILRLLLPRYQTLSSRTTKSALVNLSTVNEGSRIKSLTTFKYRLSSKKDNFKKVAPFALLAVAAKKESRDLGAAATVQDDGVFVLLARPMSITVYHDSLSETASSSPERVPVVFGISPTNELTTLSVSSNGKDVACGHRSGEIRVMTNMLGSVQEYYTAMDRYNQQAGPDGSINVEKPTYPTQRVISRKLHWHSHPVATLSYDGSSSSAEPMLYSGGNESVLVTWQLSRGTYKPADVLPRLALGGIVHIVGVEQAGEPNGILVYCSDNSLQLFESHNRSLMWKIQGLAAGETPEVLHSYPSLAADPKSMGSASSQLVLTGLSHAPGYVHWYDPRTQQVTKSLEVAPYNRVSRAEPGDSPMPSPSITHCAWSKSGDDLMTVDTVPTENASVGTVEKLSDGASVGVISTLRFWSIPKGGKTYELTAAMTYPHNSENMVSAVALSLDGKFACTVSNDEKAFRIWRQVKAGEENNTGRKSPAWACQYKVTTPAGYSNFATGRSAVAFSSDASTLAISFGHMITLWDHHEMALLTSLRHIDDSTPVDSVSFLDTKKFPDMLLSYSTSGVSLQSPYGSRGPVNLGWSWVLPSDAANLTVCHAEFLSESDLVAVAIYNETTDRCRIVWIDAVTGEPHELRDGFHVVDDIPGKILSVTGVGRAIPRSNWTRTRVAKASLTPLCVLTAKGEMIVFDSSESSESEMGLEVADAVGARVSNIPVISVRTDNVRKRPRAVLGAPELGDESANKKLSLNHFGGVTGDGAASSTLASAELPYLRGSFARAFVARNLRRVGS